jgi:hypothetical protein
LIDKDDPAFDGLTNGMTLLQKSTALLDSDDESNNIDGEYDRVEEDNIPDDTQSEDNWIAGIAEAATYLSVVAVNIHAHQVWITCLELDQSRQAFIDFLDILKVRQLQSMQSLYFHSISLFSIISRLK